MVKIVNPVSGGDAAATPATPSPPSPAPRAVRSSRVPARPARPRRPRAARPRAARLHDRPPGVPADLPDQREQFVYRNPFLAADVHREVARRTAGQPPGRREVCLGEVGDVDVVTDAGAVRCRIVVTEDPRGLVAGEAVEDHRDHVEHTGVGQLGCGRARHVEVAQAHGRDAVRPARRADQPLPGELRLAIRAHRCTRSVLRDEVHIRVAVDGRGRGEEEALDARPGDRLQQRRESAHVLLVVARRLGHGLADLLARGEMHHTRHRVLGEDALEQIPVQ